MTSAARHRLWFALALGLPGCAATTAPTPPPEETLVILNAGSQSLTLIPVDSIDRRFTVGFGPLPERPTDVAVRNGTALVAGGKNDAVIMLSLRGAVQTRRIELAAGSGAASVTIVDDNFAYVTNPGLNTVTRIGYGLTLGDTASVAVGPYPIAAVLTRGRLFVINANVAPCLPSGSLCPGGPSWITVIDPISNTRVTGIDSIPLPDQGTAVAADVGGDGLIYVVTSGEVSGVSDVSDEPGRLVIIDPIRREEIGSFSGFGAAPGRLVSDGEERLLVTSVRDGLMEFNTRTRRVVRGAGNGIPVSTNVAAAIDDEGRVYAIEAGDCGSGQIGRLRIFRPDLTESRTAALGVCPTAALMVKLPGVAAEP